MQSYCLDGADEAEEEEQLFETWLLLEYCDKGSLQDAVDRGWFHTNKHGHVDSKTKPNMRAIRSVLLISRKRKVKSAPKQAVTQETCL